MAADARSVATTYFAALARRDVDAAAACWAPDGVDILIGQSTAEGPDGVRAFFSELFAAVPDFTFEVETVVAEGDHAAVRWHATGTFSGESAFQGIAPTGQRITQTGLDLLRVRDGLIVHNDAFSDGLGLARQLGMLPPAGSRGDQGMLKAFNARTRAARRFAGTPAEPVADGVWRVRGGVPRAMNVYLIEDDGGGVTVFDTGVKSMASAITSAASGLGGINRVVLSHAHIDHRGSAGALGAPVLCHPADRADAEGDAGRRYAHLDRLAPHARLVYPTLLRMWDGGPVTIDGTVDEGDDVSGFRVVHVPGHAPGQIALFRERDGVALSSDAFYTLNIETGLHGAPRLPHEAFNEDTEQARASVGKLAALGPSAAWPGHAEPITGDVAAQLARI
jgi:glyoxylase-like metal-dependent hydrolase (beta-lactamase superfamily II)/ketosteroid isomerase-like protein